jgi:hypothetical protein
VIGGIIGIPWKWEGSPIHEVTHWFLAVHRVTVAQFGAVGIYLDSANSRGI